MNKVYIGVGVAIILIGVFFITNRKDVAVEDSTKSSAPQTEVVEEITQEVAAKIHTVTYTKDGYVPKSLTVTVGDTVTWVNDTETSMWTASAQHPTHTQYPGSGIEKCDTVDEVTIFDACRAIAHGSQYSFTFTEAGTWRYHNHLATQDTGTIVVK